VPACTCDERFVEALSASAARLSVNYLRLPSGAGHDAMALGGLCPTGMLFVRCSGGISHNPAEAITAEDAEAAVRVLLDFVMHLDPRTLSLKP
jgi:allantoate deiminase